MAEGGRLRIRFEPPDLVQRLRQGGAIMEDALSDALEDLARQMEGHAKKLVPKHMGGGGGLAGSIAVDKPSKLTREVGSGLQYAPYVEFGTRPHWPPYAAIRDWTWLNRRKFGASGQRDVARIAKFVQRAIARRGTKAQPFLRPAFDEVQNNMVRVVTKYAQEALGRMGDGNP